MKRMSKEDEEKLSKVAMVFKMPISMDVYDWCELGERWEERDDTSENVVTLKLGKRSLTMAVQSVWPAVSELPRLSELRLDHNDLHGGFPQALPPHLERLYLDNNPRLGGSLPQKMRYRTLSVLWLGNCGLEGPLPYGIGELWGLKQLILHDNKLTGRLPDAWATLPVLEVVDLRQNSFKGSLPRSMSRMSSLVQLDLSFNKFSGEVPTARLAPLTSLQWLNLTHCQFLDTNSAQRELTASLPNAVVRIHDTPKPFVPSEKPSFPPPVGRNVAAETAAAPDTAVVAEASEAPKGGGEEEGGDDEGGDDDEAGDAEGDNDDGEGEEVEDVE